MTDASDLMEELAAELEERGQTLGELLQTAVEDPSAAPDVVEELFREAQESGQSLGEVFQRTGQDVLEEFADGDVSLVDGDLLLDLGDERFPLDPTDDDVLDQLDVFGVGESLGLLPGSEDR